MGKRESPKSGCDQWISDIVAFKLDNLQPVRLILFQDVSNIWSLYWVLPFLITPQGRATERIWRKGNHQEWM